MPRFKIRPATLQFPVKWRGWVVMDQEHEEALGITTVAVKANPDFWRHGEPWPRDMIFHGCYFEKRQEAAEWVEKWEPGASTQDEPEPPPPVPQGTPEYCKYGHDLKDPKNLYVYRSSRNNRQEWQCRECLRIRRRKK